VEENGKNDHVFPMWVVPHQVFLFRKSRESQINLHMSWATASSRALPSQVQGEGRDFRQGAWTVLYLHTQKPHGF